MSIHTFLFIHTSAAAFIMSSASILSFFSLSGLWRSTVRRHRFEEKLKERRISSLSQCRGKNGLSRNWVSEEQSRIATLQILMRAAESSCFFGCRNWPAGQSDPARNCFSPTHSFIFSRESKTNWSALKIGANVLFIILPKVSEIRSPKIFDSSRT